MNDVTAYLGLGSNLDDPIRQIRSARQRITLIPCVQEIAFSSLYRSAPMGPSDQPDYVNAVMAIHTSLTAFDLLKELQAIELSQGRVRNLRWGARTLDLDILLYGEDLISSETLSVPHIGLCEREFVLYPLAEIADPNLEIPGKGKLSELLSHCPRKSLALIEHA